ncbi:MAG: hypothetical protein CVV50_05070 [Spirochaetae bacterium HGW-Spirochaetae-6]|nr:MAG: hypothetical protein CVV50_05070 [Spirochaetae bacterium HGW-Spirochaetae-6]
MLFVGIIVGLTVAFYSYFQVKTDKVLVPNLVGTTVLDAVDMLQRHELRPFVVSQVSRDVPRFVVMEQGTPAGELTKRGREVVVTVSSGETLLKLPDYTGKNYFQIKTFVESLGEKERKFFVKEVKWIDNIRPFGEIVVQHPQKDNVLDQLTGVTFWVSTGRETQVPALNNLYLEEALYQLKRQEYNFSVNYKTVSDGSLDGKVIDQFPQPGTKTERFQNVSLTVGQWEKKKGVFQLLSFPVTEELNRRKIRVAFFDSRGKQIVFEGRVFLGEDFSQLIRAFGEGRAYIYILDGAGREEFHKELQL